MADDGDVRLVVVLLEEHPLEHLCAVEAVRRHERRPLPRYQRIAFDSARWRPSSSSSTGTRSAGFFPPRTSSRPVLWVVSMRRRSYGMPSWESSSRTLKQLPDSGES